MTELYINVNWLAVITGAVGAFALGGLWYSNKLFGEKWAQGSHIKPVDGHPVFALIVQGIGTFLMAWVIGIAIGAGAWLVSVLVVLTIATVMAGGCLFSQKSNYAVLTESGFVVANGIIMLVCQAVL